MFWWLWISYGLLFVGELTAWWIPYLFRPEPERAARYQAMFGATHAFVPERNDIRPNTLHVILHIVTLMTLVVLGAVTAQHGWANRKLEIRMDGFNQDLWIQVVSTFPCMHLCSGLGLARKSAESMEGW